VTARKRTIVTAKQRSPKAAARKRSNGIDAEAVHRRRREVNRLRADGYTQREIADALFRLHMNGGTQLFTFITSGRRPIDESKLTFEEMRERAFATVRDDVSLHRKESQAEQPDAERFADDRYLLSERLRVFLKRLILRMEGDVKRSIAGEQDNGKYNQMMRTAIEIAVRIGRLQGIETEKPIEVRLPERYRAWIDEDGIIHRKKCDDDEVPN
jgi:hypothetical protein